MEFFFSWRKFPGYTELDVICGNSVMLQEAS